MVGGLRGGAACVIGEHPGTFAPAAQAQDAQPIKFKPSVGEQHPRAKPLQDPALTRATGRRIASVRRARGLTQQAIADLVGTHQGTVGGWERGRNLPAPCFYPGLRRALGCTLDYLFAGDASGLSRELRRRLGEPAPRTRA
jgi:DNA-binding transcriptional regulator YiaG